MAKTNTESTNNAVVFKDKAFKSRTIIIDDGRSFPVEKSRIEAQDPALIKHLDNHPDFERVTPNE